MNGPDLFGAVRLATLAAAARADIEALSYPDRQWLAPRLGPEGEPVEDVLIIGGGQSGLMIGAHLKREGLARIVILDAARPGEEGPWRTYARMTELRTPKTTVGAELGLPNLSLRRWHEARYGAAAWEAVERLPRTDWADYLTWHAETVGVKVESETLATDICEAGDLVRIDGSSAITTSRRR